MPQAPKLQPVLLAGALIGALSGLPFISAGNICCCLWVVMGGALGLWISQSNHPYPVTAADGALIGLMAGLFGGLVAIPLNIVFEPMQRQMMLRMLEAWQVQIPPEFRGAIESSKGPVLIIINGLVATVVFGIFGMAGGLLGVALFKKKDGPPPGTTEVLPPNP